VQAPAGGLSAPPLGIAERAASGVVSDNAIRTESLQVASVD
jgi:hypothetical protein